VNVRWTFQTFVSPNNSAAFSGAAADFSASAADVFAFAASAGAAGSSF
jgi:hypothetical protein